MIPRLASNPDGHDDVRVGLGALQALEAHAQRGRHLPRLRIGGWDAHGAQWSGVAPLAALYGVLASGGAVLIERREVCEAAAVVRTGGGLRKRETI